MKNLRLTLLFLFATSTSFALGIKEPHKLLATAMDGGINDIDYVALEKAKKEAEEKKREQEEKERKEKDNKK
ncbi:MAG: hypothetical protein KFB93_01325 [Simkaniaceae bacterium]|nr:MAG: hypothetical protein KFB93_01325 [Simkaniaceae bacterium]